MRLYEITGELQALLNDIEDGLIPEEAIADTLGMVQEEFDDKVESVACAFKNLLAEAEAIKAESDKLKERYKKKEKMAERLKEYLSVNLLAAGKDKFESAKNVISFRKSEALKIDNEDLFIAWARESCPSYLTVKEEVKVDKKAVTEALNNGLEFDGVSTEKRMNIQIK